MLRPRCTRRGMTPLGLVTIANPTTSDQPRQSLAPPVSLSGTIRSASACRTSGGGDLAGRLRFIRSATPERRGVRKESLAAGWSQPRDLLALPSPNPDRRQPLVCRTHLRPTADIRRPASGVRRPESSVRCPVRGGSPLGRLTSPSRRANRSALGVHSRLSMDRIEGESFRFRRPASAHERVWRAALDGREPLPSP